MLKKLFIVLIILFVSIHSYANRQISIFTSIQPISYIIEKIGGENVEVYSMLREGDNPHTYEPLPSQLVLLSKADLYIKLGSGIEFEQVWLNKIKEINKNMLFINAGKNIKLIETTKKEQHNHKHLHNHKNKDIHTKDPHIWLSLSNAIIITENIRNALIEYDKTNKKYYTENAEQIISELLKIKNNTNENLKNVKNRKFLILHPSLGYFANEFDLIQIPVEIEGKEPGPKHINNIIQQAKKNNIRVIFASENFNLISAEIIANEIDGQVVLINELSKDYVNNLKLISESFQNNLKQ